ncbi:MAG: hypothetical protein ACI8UO_006194 [Verrucomicrobiales bacterium]|jgi:hypothetical protein
MATIKIACKKCGQRVSGDERFFGNTVQCPICSSDIAFPLNPEIPDSSDDDISSLPSAKDEIPAGGMPTAPRPAGPPPSSQPEAPQPYQRSESAAPFPQQPQQYPQQFPQQFPQQQGFPQQQQLPQGIPGQQQMPGGPLIQPGLPGQPGLPAGFDQPGGMVTQGMPAPAPYGAMPVQQGVQAAPLQHDPNVGGEKRSADDNTSGVMPMVTLIIGFIAIIPFLAPLLGPAAIIMGHLTLIRVNENDKSSKTKTMIGLILGYASIAILIGILIIWKVVSPDSFLWGIGGGGEAVEES